MQLKTKLVTVTTVTALIIFGGFYALLQTPTTKSDALFQLAPFNTFSTGNYTGTMPYSELAKHGDFGIGTFDGLDGEMIALNGHFYQIPSTGTPKEADPNQKAPYATITFFDADKTLTISSLNYTQLKAYLDTQLTSKNAIYAIKVTGTVDYAQTRSPQKQIEPYPNITQALKTQSVWGLSNVSATAAGFWFPSSMDGVDSIGYHLHLITQDNTAGGHLLDCIIRDATVEIDQIDEYNLVLP